MIWHRTTRALRSCNAASHASSFRLASIVTAQLPHHFARYPLVATSGLSRTAPIFVPTLCLATLSWGVNAKTPRSLARRFGMAPVSPYITPRVFAGVSPGTYNVMWLRKRPTGLPRPTASVWPIPQGLRLSIPPIHHNRMRMSG